MYGKMETGLSPNTPTPRWMRKSAQVIDGEGVGVAPLRKRVRKRLKMQEIKEEGWFA